MRPLVTVFLFAALAAGAVGRAADPKPKEVKLPSEVDRVCLAGKGEYLLLLMKKLDKIAVYDLKVDKIAGYLDVGSADVFFAGTADGAVVYNNDKKTFQAWSLSTFELKLTVTSPAKGTVAGVYAGHASTGPALVVTSNGPVFLDAGRLKIVETDPFESSQWLSHPQSRLHCAASADGGTFAAWCIDISPSGARSLRLDGKKMVTKYEHETVGYQIPSADGSLFYTRNGVFGPDLKPLSKDEKLNQPNPTLPTLHPAYYLGITVQEIQVQERTPTQLTLYTAADHAPILTLTAPKAFGKVDRFDPVGTLSLYERIVAHPGLKKILFVDERRTSLHVLPLDIVKALDDKGIDYLLAESLPETAAQGRKYEYAIKVLSKAGKVQFKLDSGPKGMAVSKDGLVTWAVPMDFKEKKVGVVISIEDGSKQQIFHAFTVLLPEVKK